MREPLARRFVQRQILTVEALLLRQLDPLLSALKPLKSLITTDEPYGPPHPHHPWRTA